MTEYRRTTAAAVLLATLLSCTATAQPRLVEVARGFSNPVAIGFAGEDRLFVVEQRGTVRVVRDGEVLPEPFLDVTDRVRSGGERGLLGLAFPPDFAATGRFYAYYIDLNGDSVLSRFLAEGDAADPASEQVLLTQVQPYSNHNGGQLAFGPDGYLYLGLGDGGSGGDPQGNGQPLDTLLGKVLRLDVSGDRAEAPADNPFVRREGARPEVWAYGLRNPWRFSFDRGTGDLYIADVGQNAFEEVNLLPAGSGPLNFGWNAWEGSRRFSRTAPFSDVTFPIAEYTHDGGHCSITGGYVYRGRDIPALDGVYLFADYCSGVLWGLRRGAEGWIMEVLADTDLQPSAFGEDLDG